MPLLIMGDRRNRVILCLGSNRDKEKNMERATEMLRARFIYVDFSRTVCTEPVGSPSKELFLNRVAIFRTDESIDEIKRVLKEIERLLGRKPEDKRTGSIPIDIDLIAYDDMVLKPIDMERDYVRNGVVELLRIID